MLLNVKNLSKQYGEKSVLNQLQFSIKQGECFGIIGPNGSGKSTLLKLLSGLETASSGQIYLKGKKIESYARKDIAKWVAVLQQEAMPPIGFSVREVVEMGRFPFQSWLGKDEIDTKMLIDSILEKMSLTFLSDRPLEHLSGGERQRVALAKIMAQQPSLLMLDEPTTYLDIGHQIHLLDQIKKWQSEAKMTVIAVLHDLNLAALYCDRLLLLHDKNVMAVGRPDEIMQADLMEQVYGVRPVIVEHPTYHVPQIILQGKDAKTNMLQTKELYHL